MCGRGAKKKLEQKKENTADLIAFVREATCLKMVMEHTFCSEPYIATFATKLFDATHTVASAAVKL